MSLCGSGFRLLGALGFRVRGMMWFRVWGFRGFRVWGFIGLRGFRVWRFIRFRFRVQKLRIEQYLGELAVWNIEKYPPMQSIPKHSEIQTLIIIHVASTLNFKSQPRAPNPKPLRAD